MSRALVVAGAQERVRVAGDAVGEAEVLVFASAELLRPDAGAQLRVERPRAPQPLNRRSRYVVDLQQHGGDERATRAVQKLVRIGRDALARCSGRSLAFACDQCNAELAFGVRRLVRRR